MKNKIKICLATTGLSLVLLTLVATLCHAQFLCISTVYEVFLSNIVIHAGLILLERFESPYCLVETLIEVGYILVVLILFGLFFNWYNSIPVWVLSLIGIATYIIGCFIDLFKMTNNLSFINKQLDLQNKQHHK